MTPLVVVDADVLGRRRTGDETYVSNLLRELGPLAEGSRLRIAAVTRRPDLVPPGIEPVELATGLQELRMAWTLPRLLRRLGAALVHTQHALPLRPPCPCVVTVHDLSFVRRPELMSRKDRLVFRTVVPRAVRRAARVLSVSERTKRDLADLYGVPEGRIVVTPNGVDPAFHADPPFHADPARADPLFHADPAHADPLFHADPARADPGSSPEGAETPSGSEPQGNNALAVGAVDPASHADPAHADPASHAGPGSSPEAAETPSGSEPQGNYALAVGAVDPAYHADPAHADPASHAGPGSSPEAAETPSGSEPQGNYALAVGAVERRKNQLAALEAASAVGLPLVVVGPEKDRGLAAELRRRGARLEGYVATERLADLYRGAACVVQASRYEGFGLPVLEAMACGTPVVAVREPALVEVAGDAAVLVDESGLADGIRRALAERDRLRGAGLERARAFSWRASAERTLAVYREVLGV